MPVRSKEWKWIIKIWRTTALLHDLVIITAIPRGVFIFLFWRFKDSKHSTDKDQTHGVVIFVRLEQCFSLTEFSKGKHTHTSITLIETDIDRQQWKITFSLPEYSWSSIKRWWENISTRSAAMLVAVLGNVNMLEAVWLLWDAWAVQHHSTAIFTYRSELQILHIVNTFTMLHVNVIKSMQESHAVMQIVADCTSSFLLFFNLTGITNAKHEETLAVCLQSRVITYRNNGTEGRPESLSLYAGFLLDWQPE